MDWGTVGTIIAALGLQSVWIAHGLGQASKRIDDLREHGDARMTDLRDDLGARLGRIEDRVGGLERERA